VYDRRQQDKSKVQVQSPHRSTEDAHIGSDDEPDWLRNFVPNKDNLTQEKKINKKFGFGGCDRRRNRKESCKDLFSRDLEEEEDCNKRSENKSSRKKNDGVELSDDEFLLDEYESEEEGALGGGKSKRKAGGVSISSSSDEEGEKDGSDGEEEEEEKAFKIYFCSRTHSQLSQFIEELRKTLFSNEINVVCLGSRKNFCINEGTCILYFLH
jgi:chromosome transmission fidelity protein 1